jgi:hypothetical protein
MLAAITSPAWQPAIFCQIGFSTGPQYLWSGIGTINWNSQNWTGLGSLLSIGQNIEEGSTVEARGITIELSGLDPNLMPAALSECQLGLPVIVWLAAMSGGAPIVSPTILYSGVTDQPSIEVGPDSVVLSLACESILTSMNVPVDRRLTPQDQNMTWPGDTGLMYVYQILSINLYWGSQSKGSAGAAKQGESL